MSEEMLELKAKLEAHRDVAVEELKMAPEDDELRDLLEDVEEAIELLEAEDGQMSIDQLVELEAKMAARLQK